MRRSLSAFMVAGGLVANSGPAVAQTPVTPPPATEIYLAPMRLLPSAPTMGPARAASENPGGYDNQPAFGPDGRAMLFTSNRDKTQTDIYFLELQTRQIRRMTETAESEYSPTLVPGDGGVSVIRVEKDGTQRVWRMGEGGTALTVVAPAVKPVGYHAWIDASHLAVFVLGTPATFQVVDLATGTATVRASDIGRAVQRRPTGAISFVQRVNDRWIVRELDPATDEIRDVVPALEGSTDRDTAWGPDGSLFMTKGGEVHWWRPGQTGWTLLADVGIGTLSRMAVSPDGRWMALVAVEGSAGSVPK